MEERVMLFFIYFERIGKLSRWEKQWLADLNCALEGLKTY
jgi:hypothetical protein